jgi:cathepsin D
MHCQCIERLFAQLACATPISVALTFAGMGTGAQAEGSGQSTQKQSFSIAPSDFTLQKISPTECVGAFFVIDNSNAGEDAPQWIIGDTFLVSEASRISFLSH